MRHILVMAALTMAMSVSAFAQAGGVEQQIQDLEKQSRAAALRGDPTFGERHFADDYMATSPRGAVRTKAEAMADLKSGDVKYTAIDVDETKVRIYGDTAVMTGRATIKGMAQGQDISGQYRVTRVWAKQGGEWKLVAHQSTRIADQAAPQTKP
jgi:ketosteroid isomerase-like protein